MLKMATEKNLQKIDKIHIVIKNQKYIINHRNHRDYSHCFFEFAAGTSGISST